MIKGRLKSKTLNNDDRLILEWFKHRDNVDDYGIKYFNDHYEIYYTGTNDLQRDLTDFLDIIWGEGKRIY